MGQPETRQFTLAEAQAELAARPSIEETMAEYDRLLGELRQAITDVTKEAGWTSEEGSSAACTEFGDVSDRLEAEVRSTRMWTAPGATEGQWPAALEEIMRITAANNFEPIQVMADEPGNHVLFIQGPHGAVLTASSGVNWVLSIRTGCHRISESTGASDTASR